MRQEVRAHCDRHVWLLFEEARDRKPADPASLLRHMGADARHWPLDLTFFQNQSVPIYPVTSADLEDDRWTVRAWHADLWLRRLWCHFTVKDISEGHALTSGPRMIPQFWLPSERGNANLLRVPLRRLFRQR